ncbi:MAG: hemolysin [Nitrospirae bacterium CG_4_10_14_3_um_filter_44_29]|nr:MAG: hemolysin [Nitrospirae bacterium CG02_land_8_20_14_3_00_44_33]PIW89821.1 MAG: hemolysin [Nitrospirae bacterium CG_4_8_14_3_um_filter_44_28]PIX89660.1 MAG: hemolysin [Nitrospirae bacterium CG_4_10_14_3_um_filter_44_29]
MEPHSIFSIIVIALSLIAIAILSGSESSFIAVSKIRIRSLMEKGDVRAQAVQKLLDEHDKLFSAVILSGNLFTILATSIGTALALRYFGEDGIIIATIVMTFLTVVFGELAPKTFAVAYSEKVSLLLARPIAFYVRLISPLVWIFTITSNFIIRMFGGEKKSVSPFVTEEEIKTMINIGEEEGTLEEEEKEMLHKVFEFGDKVVTEAMVPRTEIISIPEESTVGDALKLVLEEGYSRYPVIEDSIDNITGILYVKDIMIQMAQGKTQNYTPITELVREAYYVPENKMVTELLDEMQKNKFQIAIVMDEYGGTAGLITLEDIIEEIVGGLQDEFEAMGAEKEVEIIDERTFIVTGQTGIDEINELVGVELASEDFHTIGGFVFGLFRRLPMVGEQVRYHNLRFLILEMEDRKVSRIKIAKL